MISNYIVPKNDNIVALSFYNAQAAAGEGERVNDILEENYLYFDKRWLKNILGVNPSNLVIIQAKGDSMDSGLNQTDDIKDGDLLMIDKSQKEGNNKIFVFRNQDNELRVKKLRWNINGNVEIISKNPKYPVECLSNDNFSTSYGEIIGRVVWNGSKENV